jgi:hypothetical protein
VLIFLSILIPDRRKWQYLRCSLCSKRNSCYGHFIADAWAPKSVWTDGEEQNNCTCRKPNPPLSSAIHCPHSSIKCYFHFKKSTNLDTVCIFKRIGEFRNTEGSQKVTSPITVTRRLTTGIRSEKRVVRRFLHCANVIEYSYTKT